MSVIALVLEMIQLGLPIANEVMAGAHQEMLLSGQDVLPSVAEAAVRERALLAAHTALQAAQQGA